MGKCFDAVVSHYDQLNVGLFQASRGGGFPTSMVLPGKCKAKVANMKLTFPDYQAKKIWGKFQNY